MKATTMALVICPYTTLVLSIYLILCFLGLISMFETTVHPFFLLTDPLLQDEPFPLFFGTSSIVAR